MEKRKNRRKTIYDYDKNLEEYGFVTKVIRFFTVPLLNILPGSFLKKIMKNTSDDARMVIENVGSTQALETMYTRYSRDLFVRGLKLGLGNLFWHHFISQSKAVRNRLRIVEEKLENELSKLIDSGRDNINILTVGGGSCRAIIQSLSQLSEKISFVQIRVVNIDKNEKAIKLGKKLAVKFNVAKNFKWINNTASNIKTLVAENSINIVEMVGLLDYFPDEKAIRIIGQIYRCLKTDGLFLTGNVFPNSEMPFISKIGWPKMYFRTQNDLEQILKNAGFLVEKGNIIFEPLKSHIIAVIKK